MSSAQAYHDAVRAFRRGEVERAVDRLAAIEETGDFRRERHEWLAKALDEDRSADIHAALLLHTELAFERLSTLPPGVNPLRPPAALSVQLDAVERIHNAIRRLPSHRGFLRTWYLLWEAYRQTHPLTTYPPKCEYLLRALESFPDDGELLLAMGSRYEQRWWLQADNAHRVTAGRTRAGVEFLRSAREFLQKSVKARPAPSEALMRLSRVLILLGELDEAAAILARFQQVREGPAFQYLAFLFEGDLHERRGNLSAAARAYDNALKLVNVPQSARVARAHVAHALGERRDAASHVIAAMQSPLTQSDPYWWYVRGQAWRLEFYLSRTRGLVSE